MREQGILQLELSRRTGIPQPTLSACLRGERSFSLDNVDKISEALGLPIGSLYPYIELELLDGRDQPGKMIRYIFRCFEIGLIDVGRKHLSFLETLDKYYYKDIFILGDKLNKLGYLYEASFLYTIIINKEKPSPILATAYFRLFVIRKEGSREDAYEYAIYLMKYLDLLPKSIGVQLVGDSNDLRKDAYHQLIAFFSERQNWNRVYELSQKLALQYKDEQDSLNYGRSLILMATASFYQQNYKHALEVIDEYISIKDPNEEFLRWGITQKYLVRIELGEIKLIPEFINWLIERGVEFNECASIILKAFSRRQMFDEMRDFFERYLETIYKNFEDGKKTNRDRIVLIQIHLHYAQYLLYIKKEKVAVEVLLQVIQETGELHLHGYLLEAFRLLTDVDLNAEQKMKLKLLLDHIRRC